MEPALIYMLMMHQYYQKEKNLLTSTYIQMILWNKLSDGSNITICSLILKNPVTYLQDEMIR